MKLIDKLVERFIKSNKRMKRWKRCLSVLAALVVFVTTYALVLPGITLDSDTASTKPGIEIAASENEADEAGTVYESVPEEEPDEETKDEAVEEPAPEEDSAKEESGSESGNQSAEADSEQEETASTEAVNDKEESESGNTDMMTDDQGDASEETAAAEQTSEKAAEVEENADAASTENAAAGLTNEVAPEVELITEQTTLAYEGEDYKVYADFGEGAKLPVGVELKVREITAESDPEAYQDYYEKALSQMQDKYDEKTTLSFARFYDISFVHEGAEVEPAGDVKVRIEYDQPVDIVKDATVDTVHFDKEDEENVEIIDTEVDSEKKVEEKVEKEAVKAVEFTSDQFSVYGVVGAQALVTEWTLTTPDGENVTYVVTVKYGEEAEIPEGSELRIAEFVPESKEYIAAREAVVAKKLSESSDFNADLLGLNAFDVSIYDAEGNVVEPKAPVEVSIKVKQLPEEVVKGGVLSSLEIQHLDESTEEVKVETVASVVDGSIQTKDNTAEAVFEVGSFSTFTVNWNNNQTTVHYGYMEGGTFHEFTEQPSPVDINTNYGWAYLLYDFEDGNVDYNYVQTYYSAEEVTDPKGQTEIAPVLRYTNRAWRYYASEDYSRNALATDSSWTAPANGSHIYVVYEKPDISNGGTPKIDEHTPMPHEPKITKNSKVNGDGTNTLSLTVTGRSKDIEVESLADVIVVLDLSSSMQNNIHNDSTTGSGYATNENSRYYQAINAVKTLANNLYQKNADSGKSLIRMGLVTFAGNAQVRQDLTADKTTFLNKVNAIDRYEGKGTNWEHSLKLANEMSVDPNRATFVIFVTDGEPTTSQTRGDSGNYQSGDDGSLNDTMFVSGNYGGVVPDQYGPHSQHRYYYDPMHYYLRTATFGSTNAGDRLNYTAAHDDAKSIVDHGKNFYVIAISSDVGTDALNEILDKAGVGRDHGIPATNQQQLIDAFAKIESEISGLLGWADVEITDGITGLTQTVKKSGLLEVDGDFKYWRAPAPANWATMTEEQKAAYVPADTDFVEWTAAEMQAAGCAPAQYDTASGAVLWNMGDDFFLEDGVSYKVTFDVWPKQEAYDYIAALKNQSITYDQLPEDVQAQIDPNTLNLRTNEEDAGYTYKAATKMGEDVSTQGDPIPGTFPPVDPLLMVTDELTVEKTWQNVLDPSYVPSDITIDVYGLEGTTEKLYKSFYLTKEGGWKASDGYISCGLMRLDESTGRMQLLETGHDFILKERGEGSYYWDMSADTYHPMVINNVRTTLVLVDPEDVPAGMGENVKYYKDGDDKYYRIGGSVYKEVANASDGIVLKAHNDHRCYIDLFKKVEFKDEDGTIKPMPEDETLFTYKIKLIDALGPDNGNEGWLIFTVRDKEGNNLTDQEVETTAAFRKIGGVPYFGIQTGTEFTLKIKQGWQVRFLNVSKNSEYHFEEVAKDGYTCSKIEVTGTEEQYRTIDIPKVDGTVGESNQVIALTYTNQVVPLHVYLLKTTENGKSYPLSGAVFDLYTKAAYESDPQGDPILSNITSSAEAGKEGVLDLGLRVVGDYYLVEKTAPEGYVPLKNPVQMKIERDNSKCKITIKQDMTERQDVTPEDKDYDAFITNNPGVELPYTGGPGTFIYTLSGLALIMATALMYGFRMRRRERRLK